jgi:type IX secretion system PorP/SprF family membrane protein
MRSLFLSFVVIVICGELKAQDPHFSQFFSSPLTLNPAFTGKFDGTYRVAGNYRNQWPTINRAYQTTTLSMDFQIMRNQIAANDTWGLGLMGYTDKSANGAVSFNYATVSTAFHKGLDEEGFSQLGGGFQVTYSNMLINTADLKFEDQLTTSGFTGVTSEFFNGATLKSSYVDVNAGLLYTGSSTDKNYYYIGASGYHINRPKQEFTGALFLLNPRITVHSGGYFPVGQSGTLHVSGLFSSQGSASETVIGGAYEWTTGEETMEKPFSFFAGAWMRVKDAIIPYLGFQSGDIRMGITYDVTMSGLKTAAQTRGGVEISLIYIRRPPEHQGLPCPKF